eukprot:m.124737 g.124737  ORF g.124737 m.124737 type:complete len:135 (+) comp14479_c0_seq3:3-407(+)
MIKLTNVNNFWTVWRTLYGLNLDSLLTTFTDGGNQSDALNWMSLMTSAFSYMDDIEGLDLSSMTDRFSSLMDSLGDATDALKTNTIVLPVVWDISLGGYNTSSACGIHLTPPAMILMNPDIVVDECSAEGICKY